ncbi:hypothetical protein [Aliivibrio fischeri]|uniref:hypothetical protein n=1 Tax=Aliivibrio fischeri TaxID=668 RepID=UPI001F26D62B|nr:hypothetical protein [Aliivibrio fischeri]MCE4935354.1 hypothetical protein [Aliivibrio fischeri]
MIRLGLPVGLLLLLTGCHEVYSPGVFTGVATSENGDPIKIEVTASESEDILMTQWDDRDRQSSYVGKMDNESNRISFNNGEYMCSPAEKKWFCSSYDSDFELSIKQETPLELSQFSGHYTALVDDDIYNLIISDNGKLEMTSNHCKDKAQVNLILEEQAAYFRIKSNSCSFGKTKGLINLSTDNDELTSLEIQSDNWQFPQVWIKQIN